MHSDAGALGSIDLNFQPPGWANPWRLEFERKRGRQYIAQAIQMTLAGALAETLYTRCWQQAPGLEDDDESLALNVGRPFHRPPKATQDWVNRLRFQMLETLRAPDVWAAVEVVAAELLQRNTLRGVEVRALVNQQGAKSQFSGEVVPALSRPETYDRLGLYPEP